MAVKRNSRWATILYQESAVPNFVEVLKSYKVPFLISPLHDRDLQEQNPSEFKKPHWHLMLYFESLKSQEQAREIFTAIGGVGAESVQAPVAYARYLCHMDDPDKAQYDKDDVVAYGIDYSSCIATTDMKYIQLLDIFEFAFYNGICSFSSLLLTLSNDRYDLFKVACDNAFLVKSYLSSLGLPRSQRNVSRETLGQDEVVPSSDKRSDTP